MRLVAFLAIASRGAAAITIVYRLYGERLFPSPALQGLVGWWIVIFNIAIALAIAVPIAVAATAKSSDAPINGTSIKAATSRDPGVISDCGLGNAFVNAFVGERAWLA